MRVPQQEQEREMVATVATRGEHAEAEGLSPGWELARAVSNLHREHIGRGPTSATTEIMGDTVVCLLQDCFTPGERTLIAGGHSRDVAAMRESLAELMSKPMSEAAERATGRRVVAHLSDVNPDADMAAEIFLLEPRPGQEPKSR